MRILYLTLFIVLSVVPCIFSAEFKSKNPVKILELNEETLLENIWPGMTIKQVVQILGEPEETMLVRGSSNDSAPAIRYGIYWIIPSYDAMHVQCIIHQRGFKTRYDRAARCYDISEEYLLSIQK